MGATANLSNANELYGSGMDAVVIRNFVGGIIGGRTLDVTGFTDSVIKAGHVIIRDTQTDTYKPMPVSSGAYASLPSNHEYVGVLVSSVLTSQPLAGIMYDGEVNDLASPYPVDSIKAALKTALPTLVFLHD